MNRPLENREQHAQDMRSRYATRGTYDRVVRAPQPVATGGGPAVTAVSPSKSKKTSVKMPILIVAVAIVAVAAGSVGGYLLLRPAKQIPSTIAKQVSFGVFITPPKSSLAIDGSSFNYEKSEGILTFTGVRKDGTKISFTEQATPDSFVDVPQVYDKMISSLHGYSSFESVNGKVNLTRPQQLQGGEAAVMNAKGTLMFARSSKALPDNEWRQLFSGLELAKP